MYFHKKANIAITESDTCDDFKHEISTFNRGGYHPLRYIPNIHEAIVNAKIADSNTDYFLPSTKETKVYQLAEAIMQVIGVNDFNKFVEFTLPMLVSKEVSKYNKKDKK